MLYRLDAASAAAGVSGVGGCVQAEELDELCPQAKLDRGAVVARPGEVRFGGDVRKGSSGSECEGGTGRFGDRMMFPRARSPLGG